MERRTERRLRTIARGLLRAALGARLPKLSGEARVSGIHGPIEIMRDLHGVPSIRAGSDHDVFFGLGFCHGQDRAFQLEIIARTVRGTLAAAVGDEGLAVDRLSRRVGFLRAGRAQLAVARPEVRAQLEAYAAGINAAHDQKDQPRAHELVLLGCEPCRWQAADAQAASVLLCFALAANWDVELLRLEMLERDGEAALLALDAPYDGDLPVSRPPGGQAGEAAARILDDLSSLRDLFPVGGASNAWAIAPARTTTKRPILAGDPHLPPDVPAHWYLAHLVAPTWRATGASFVGIPGFGLGHNEHCAWAVTAAHADNTDLFIEEIGPDGHSVRASDGTFAACEVRTEIIEVKGKPPVVEHILETPRGPIVGPILAGARTGLSLSATWLAPRPYTGLFLAHRARSAAEVHELFREASCSSVNLVVADTLGHIGWRLGVEIPIRRGGHGTMPRPGWLADSGWEKELVPFDEMPFVIDPPDGFVASANNAPVPHGGGPFFGLDFLDGFRQQVLLEALGEHDHWSLDDVGVLQRDVRSVPFRRARSVVLAAPEVDAETTRALAFLRVWDGQMEGSSAGATVWAVTSSLLLERVVRSRAPQTAGRALGTGFHPALPVTTMITRRLGHLVRLLETQPDGFFKEGWPLAIARALGDAVRLLDERLGSDPKAWAWGDARPLRLQHALGKSVPAFDLAFGLGPVSFSGDASTLTQGAVSFIDPLGNPLGVPNLRMRIDVGDWSESRFCLLGGQSGNPLSPHYADHLEAWNRDGFAIAWSDQDIERSTKHTLRLVPS